MRKRVWVRAVVRLAIGLLTGYLAFLAAVAMNRSEMSAILMAVVVGVAATLIAETWQTNRRARKRRQNAEPPTGPHKP